MKFRDIGVDPSDGPDEILNKRILVSAITLIMLATAAWGITLCICEPRGAVEIKGRGQMQTWFLLGLRPDS